MKLSVIIPTLNEEDYITRVIRHLKDHADERLHEIIVVDGLSSDNTCYLAKEAGARLIANERACRASQLNKGAFVATGDVFYFVHADVVPPTSYLDAIENAIQNKYSIGACRQRFDGGGSLLRINSWMTRFNFLYFRGGDQTLFVTRALFEQLGGFSEHYVIMEDYDFMRRARKQEKFIVLPCSTITSARKYKYNSWLKVQLANFRAIRQFSRGVDPQIIRDTYIQSLKS